MAFIRLLAVIAKSQNIKQQTKIIKMKKRIIVLSVLTFLIQLEIISQPTFTNQSNFGIDASCSSDWGDYDNDGDLDLVVGNLNGDHIYINEGNNEFIESESLDIYPTNFVKWIDLDGDFDLDLFIGNDGTTPNYMFYNQGNGNLIQNEFLSGLDITGIDNGDFDNDGDLDLIVAAWGDDYTFIFLNDGNNNFSPDFSNEIFNEAISVSVADVDNDSDLDIITGVGCCINPSEIYKNDGTGIFSLFSQFGSENSAFISLKIADVDDDGDMDITSNNSGSDEVSIYLNDGIGNYSAMLIDSIEFSCAEFGDIDNDNDIDLVVGALGYFSDRIMVYINDGMTFTKHIIETGGFTNFPFSAVSDIAIGDSDNDGDLDIAVMRLIILDEWTVAVEQNSLFLNDFISGIENNLPNLNYRIYPNPSSDFINLELNNLEDVNVSIINPMGQVVFKKSITGKLIEQIDISDFLKGVYLITISGQNFSSIEKIIKK